MQPFLIWTNNRIYSRCIDGPRTSARNFPIFSNHSNSLHISILNLKLIGFPPHSRKYCMFKQIESEGKWQNKVIVNNAIYDIPICNKYYFYLELLTLLQISQKFCANVELIHTYIYFYIICAMCISLFSILEIVAIYFQECRISINICRYLLAYKFFDTII